MPSAISSPSDPVGTVSTSIVLLFLPSRMIEPLPKARSIWESAASSAFVLSMLLAPSTTRNVAGWAIATLLMAMILRADNAGCGAPTPRNQCTLFVLGSQYVLLGACTLNLVYSRLPLLALGSHLGQWETCACSNRPSTFLRGSTRISAWEAMSFGFSG